MTRGPYFNVNEAERLYRSGLSIRGTAKALGTNRESVRLAMNERGAIRPRLAYHEPLESRLLRRINKDGPNGCWLWTGLANNKGYGVTSIDGIKMVAHRAVYRLFRGAEPTGVDACHKCDTPLCVNPDHLFFGSRKDNMQDASAKGRLQRGERHAHAHYTEAEIRQAHRLWKEGAALRDVSRATGIPRQYLWSILVDGRVWRHLQLEGVGK